MMARISARTSRTCWKSAPVSMSSRFRGIYEKNSFLDIDLYLSMAWEDPEIGVCVCDDSYHSKDGSYQVGRNLILLPDLHVWNFKSMMRVNGLVNLGDLELKLRNDCPAKIIWDMTSRQIRLDCFVK